MSFTKHERNVETVQMEPIKPLLVFHAINVRRGSNKNDFLSVGIPREINYLAVLAGWQLIPAGTERTDEEVLGFVRVPLWYGDGPRSIRIPELEGRRDPSGAPFTGWTYLSSLIAHTAFFSALRFERQLRSSGHALMARVRQRDDLFPPIAPEGDTAR